MADGMVGASTGRPDAVIGGAIPDSAPECGPAGRRPAVICGVLGGGSQRRHHLRPRRLTALGRIPLGKPIRLQGLVGVLDFQAFASRKGQQTHQCKKKYPRCAARYHVHASMFRWTKGSRAEPWISLPKSF